MAIPIDHGRVDTDDVRAGSEGSRDLGLLRRGEGGQLRERARQSDGSNSNRTKDDGWSRGSQF